MILISSFHKQPTGIHNIPHKCNSNVPMVSMSRPTDQHLQDKRQKQTQCPNQPTGIYNTWQKNKPHVPTIQHCNVAMSHVPTNQPTFVRHHRKITRMSQRSQCPNQPGAYSRPKNNKIISSRMSRVPCPNHSQVPVMSGCQRCNLTPHYIW